MEQVEPRKRFPCQHCLKTLDPNDSDSSLRAFVVCTNCKHIIHETCFARQPMCQVCGNTNFQRVNVVGTIPPLPVTHRAAIVYDDQQLRTRRTQQRFRQIRLFVVTLVSIALLTGIASAIFINETQNRAYQATNTRTAMNRTVTAHHIRQGTALENTSAAQTRRFLTERTLAGTSRAQQFQQATRISVAIGAQYASADITDVTYRFANRGTYFCVDLLVYKARDLEISVLVWPQYATNFQFMRHPRSSSQYRDADGNTYTSTVSSPHLDAAQFTHVELFLPASEMPSGNYDFSVYLEVQGRYARRALDTDSDWSIGRHTTTE